MPMMMRGDAQLYYQLDGAGAPLVYISGFSDHSNSAISGVIRQTLATRFQVLSVDNRGSGQTQSGAQTDVQIDDMADDIAAVMDACGMAQAHIFGVSMGGAIAMTLALRHPAKVRRLIVAVSLAAAMKPPSRSPFLLATVQEMRQNNVPLEMINRYTAVFLLGEDAFKYERFMQAWVHAPADPLSQTPEGFALQTAALEHYDIRDRLHAIQAPTLVVSSPDDVLVPARLQDEIAARIPNASIKRYVGGHVFMGLPMYREAFFKDVFEFLEQG